MPGYRPARDRFREKYRVDPKIGIWIQTDTGQDVWEPCWIWIAHLNAKGYGVFKNDEKQAVLAHNFSYATFAGPLDPALERAHQCYNRPCVNYKHLKQLTHQENILQSQHPTVLAHLQNRCVKGHALEGANVRIDTTGARRCKQCFTEYQATYYAANKTRIRSRQQEYQKQYYEKNKIQINARNKAHRRGKNDTSS